jgi:hypothetical protein
MSSHIDRFGVLIFHWKIHNSNLKKGKKRIVISTMFMAKNTTYRQNMELIWENLKQLPEGQARVVLSQLWAYGKTNAPVTSNTFPALATHGFLTEAQQDGTKEWQPAMPHLKDFWRVGIQVSNDHGFLLQPRHVFEANLQAYMSSLQEQA